MKNHFSRQISSLFATVLISLSGCVPSADDILNTNLSTNPQTNQPPATSTPPAYDVIAGTYGGQVVMKTYGFDSAGYTVDTSFSDYMEVDFGVNGLPMGYFPVPHEMSVGETISIAMPQGTCDLQIIDIYEDQGYWTIEGAGSVQYPVGNFYTTAAVSYFIVWKKVDNATIEYGQVFFAESSDLYLEIGNPVTYVLTKQ